MRVSSQASALTHARLPAATTTLSSLIPGQEVHDLRTPGQLARKAPCSRDLQVTTRWISYDAAALSCYRSIDHSRGCGWFRMGEEMSRLQWLTRDYRYTDFLAFVILYGASVVPAPASRALKGIIRTQKCWEKCFILNTLKIVFKAALVNISILTMAQIATCNLKGIILIDKPTENDHPTL